MKKLSVVIAAFLLSACASQTIDITAEDTERSNTRIEDFMKQYSYAKKNCERLVAARSTYFTCPDENDNMLIQTVSVYKFNHKNPANTAVIRASWGPFVFVMDAPIRVW